MALGNGNDLEGGFSYSWCDLFLFLKKSLQKKKKCFNHPHFSHVLGSIFTRKWVDDHFLRKFATHGLEWHVWQTLVLFFMTRLSTAFEKRAFVGIRFPFFFLFEMPDCPLNVFIALLMFSWNMKWFSKVLLFIVFCLIVRLQMQLWLLST